MNKTDLEFIAEIVNGIPMVAECSYLAIDMLDNANKVIQRELRRQKHGPFSLQEAIKSGRNWRGWKSDSALWFRWDDSLHSVVIATGERAGEKWNMERYWFSVEFELGPEVVRPMAGHIR